MRSEVREMTGVCHIALTPFDADENVDVDGIGNIVRAAIDARCCGVVPLAIMGEAHKLIERERDEVLEAYVSAAGDETHVVAGVTSESTVQAIDRAQRAQRLGATAIMMAPPRNTSAGPALLDHFGEVAASVDIPLVVQDEPVTTGVKLPAPFFEQLATIDSIFAVKVEEAPSPPKVSAIHAAAPRLALFGGLGGISLYEELSRGAVGIMTGFGFPEILSRICELYAKGEIIEARDVFYRFLPLIRFEAQLGVGGVSIRKQLFFERGLISSPSARKPRAALDGETVKELNDLLEVFTLDGGV